MQNVIFWVNPTHRKIRVHPNITFCTLPLHFNTVGCILISRIYQINCKLYMNQYSWLCETQDCAWHEILLLPSSAGMLMITTAMAMTFIFVVGSLQFAETSQSHTCSERVWTEDWPWLSEILRVSWWSPACTTLSLISFTDVPGRQKQNRNYNYSGNRYS